MRRVAALEIEGVAVASVKAPCALAPSDEGPFASTFELFCDELESVIAFDGKAFGVG